MIHWFNRFSTSLLMRIVAMVLILPVGYCAAPEETTAIEAIRKMFADGLYEAVDRQSAEFASQFQNSEHLPEIWLIQARAKIRVGRVDDAILILTQNRDRAGQRLEEFDFWHAMALGAKGDWNAAADAFGRFLASHTNSVLRIQAAYHQAYSKYRAGDTAGAVALLNAPDGPIRTRSETNKGDVWIQRSLLLLADMQLASGKNTEAASTLAELPEGLTAPELAWYRSYLTARIHALSNRWAEALANLTNIWTTVTNNLSPEILAGAALLEGEAFERTGQLQRARSSYERALARTTPADQRRAAMQRIVALGSAPEAVSDTINWLESFVSSHAGDELLDIATFSIGQLRLNQYLALVRAGASTIPGTNLPVTNLLHQARARFDMVITNYPSSAFLGEAYFGRGCCLWEEGTNRLSDMLLSFKSAVEKTSSPAVREIAIFKLADTQVLMGDFATARSNYWYVATNRVGLASGTNDIAAQALFQVVRTSIDMNDMAAASAALQRLIDTSPGSPLAERAVLMLGYAYLRLGNAEAARSSFQSFVNTFTNSTLLPEVRLAISKTYEQQGAFAEAIGSLKSWIESYQNNTNVQPRLLSQAHFDLARLSYRMQPGTNAVNLFEEFCKKFPDDMNVPLAQYIMGEYYFGQGDYGKAELQFQNRALLQNTNPATREISFRARLMAGRAAVARQSYRSAREHFDWIITNGPLHVAASPIPVSIVAEAYLFRGDTFTLEPGLAETNQLARFGEAINAYSKVTENWPTNEFAPIAWGRIGECHLQLAAVDPKRYDMAADAFTKVIQSTANIAIRSQAEFELGVVREKQASLLPEADRRRRLDEAMDHYLRVLYGRNLRAGESPDPYWVKRAGLAAAELAESQNRPEIAISVYRRLLTEIPVLRSRLEKKIEELSKLVSSNGTTNRQVN